MQRVPVAAPMRRLIAGILDFGIVLTVAVLMALGFYWTGGMPLVEGKVLQAFAGLFAVCAIAYKLLWAGADTESPGVRLCGLRLVTFDGSSPSQRVRLGRVGWAVGSVVPAGLGLLWAFIDMKEHLTWHDQSSRTFLSPLPGR